VGLKKTCISYLAHLSADKVYCVRLSVLSKTSASYLTVFAVVTALKGRNVDKIQNFKEERKNKVTDNVT
jgi:hypothetical protein